MTFIESVIAGEASVDDVDDWIDDWHEGRVTQENREAANGLHDHLGMTWDEYRGWVEQRLTIESIVDAHRKEPA